MLVELDAALLAPIEGATSHPGHSDDQLVVLAICALGLGGRHRVVALQREQWQEWAKGAFPPQLVDALQLVWDSGEHAETVAQSAITVRVTPSRVRSYVGHSLVLDPPTALALLGRPLRVLLENGRNDREFLLAFARGDQRTYLETAAQQGWIVFETAGGITELKVRAEQVDIMLRRLSQDLGVTQSDEDNEICLELLRTMMISDSDAREPGKPSTEARRVAGCLERLELRFSGAKFSPAGKDVALDGIRGRFGTVLHKRAAENYAPPADILKWAITRLEGAEASALIRQVKNHRAAAARAPGAPGQPRRQVLAALALQELNAHLADVICMKRGRGDEASPATHDSVWTQLDEFQQAALQDGFGTSFSATFYGEYSSRGGLVDGSGEVREILRHILENL